MINPVNYGIVIVQGFFLVPNTNYIVFGKRSFLTSLFQYSISFLLNYSINLFIFARFFYFICILGGTFPPKPFSTLHSFVEFTERPLMVQCLPFKSPAGWFAYFLLFFQCFPSYGYMSRRVLLLFYCLLNG